MCYQWPWTTPFRRGLRTTNIVAWNFNSNSVLPVKWICGKWSLKNHQSFPQISWIPQSHISSSYVHFTVWFYSRLRKSQSINLLYFITTFEHLRTPDMSSSHLKNFKILVPLLKKSNCLGLVKKNACLTFPQSLVFTNIHQNPKGNIQTNS